MNSFTSIKLPVTDKKFTYWILLYKLNMHEHRSKTIL